MDVEYGRESLPKVRLGRFHPKSVNVRPHEIAVPQIDPRRRDGASDHVLGLSEVVLVVRTAACAVRVDESRLPATTRSPAALCVVRRRGWDVAEIDNV